MISSFWSVKGGVGTSAAAAMHAVALAGRAQPTLLVDLVGDLPAILGVDEPDGPGLGEWCASAAHDPAAIGRIGVDPTTDLRVLHRGRGELTAAPAFIDAVADLPRRIIVDAGRGSSDFEREVIAASTHRLLVIRPCYLGLRAARSPVPAPTGVVLVSEPGRALSAVDVAAVTEAPVLADIACDPAIARAIDAGLLTSRLPRRLRRSLADLTPHDS